MSNAKAAEMAAQWWAGRLQKGDKAKFKELLVPKIEAALDARGFIRLEVDYDPNEPLLAVLREIGIECRGFMFSAEGIFPKKHSLGVYPDRLVPKEGYGHWTAEIPVPA